MSGPESIDTDLLRRIDRLVDNELGETERRELLLELDRRPEAWKLCALAFLENQAWAPAIRSVAAEPVAPSPTIVPIPTPSRTPRRWLAAACVMAALFGLGVLSGRQLGRVVIVRPQAEPQSPVLVEKEEHAEALRLAGFVHLAGFGDGAGQTIPVPVLTGEKLESRLSQPPQPHVSDYERSVWEREGYRLQENRKVVSVGLDDGRHVAIPVDEVKVQYVGQIPY